MIQILQNIFAVALQSPFSKRSYVRLRNQSSFTSTKITEYSRFAMHQTHIKGEVAFRCAWPKSASRAERVMTYENCASLASQHRKCLSRNRLPSDAKRDATITVSSLIATLPGHQAKRFSTRPFARTIGRARRRNSELQFCRVSA